MEGQWWEDRLWCGSGGEYQGVSLFQEQISGFWNSLLFGTVDPGTESQENPMWEHSRGSQLMLRTTNISRWRTHRRHSRRGLESLWRLRCLCVANKITWSWQRNEYVTSCHCLLLDYNPLQSHTITFRWQSICLFGEAKFSFSWCYSSLHQPDYFQGCNSFFWPTEQILVKR